MASPDELFGIYTVTFGKVKSGTKLTNGDYVHRNIRGTTPYDEEEKLAVTIACDDVKNDSPMKSKSEFLAESKRLRS